MKQGRGTQVVRERSAKPLCVGSIPTRASSLSRISLPCKIPETAVLLKGHSRIHLATAVVGGM
jgi:hypothetical protein